jgi:transcriptional regulator with XRE-family HTH domain
VNLVRRYRLARGLSQSALAHEAGIYPSYITKLEYSGHTPPDEQRRLLIAAALNVQVAILFPDAPVKVGRPRLKPDAPPQKPKTVRRICKWCGRPYWQDQEVRIVQGDKVIRRSGHYDCLIEDIRSEKYVCK